jgi:alpha-D-ribose 1-methylphosphonate 5-triphosphate diphosphatase
MMSITTIRNARLVFADRIEDGSIALDETGILEVAVGRNLAPSSTDFDASGCLVLPGLVELHTDALEWHLRPRPEALWPSLAAMIAHDAALASAGVTTVFDSLALGDLGSGSFRTGVLSDALASLDQARDAGALRIDHYVHLRCEVCDPRTPQLFDQHRHRPDVRLVSLMDHTPGGRQYRDVEAYRARLIEDGEHDAEGRIALLTERADQFSRVNWDMIAELAAESSLVLASHDDATEQDVSLAVRSGAQVCEFPTTKQAATAARRCGLITVAGAPNVVRGGSHNGNVAAHELVQQGLLDVLTSDYVPYSLLYAPFVLAEKGIATLPESIAMVTQRPALAVGLHDRGRLGPGYRADVCVVSVAQGVPTVRAVWSAGLRAS